MPNLPDGNMTVGLFSRQGDAGVVGMLRGLRRGFLGCALLNLLLLLLSYGALLRVHYSGDTYIVYALDDSLVNIRNGRPLGYLFAKGAYFLNLQRATVQPLMTVLFLVLISVCVAVLAAHVALCCEKEELCSPIALSLARLFLVDLAVLIVFVNGFFLDWMRFPECYVMIYGPALFFTFAALYLTVSVLSNRHRTGKSLAAKWLAIALCLLLSSWCYQVSLFLYLQLAIGIALAESTRRFEYAACTAVRSGIAVVLAGLLSSIGAKVIYLTFVSRGMIDPSLPVRTSVLSLEAIAENARFILENLRYVLIDGLGSNLPYLLPLALCASLFGALYSVISVNRNHLLRAVVSAFAIVAILALVFAVQLISANHDLSARTLLGAFGAISGLLLVSICGEKPESCKMFLTVDFVILLTVLVAGMIACRIGSRVELQINEQERWYSGVVESAIREYEDETGNVVTTIVRASDAAPSLRREPIDAPLFCDRTWSIATYWTTTYMINEYEGTSYVNREMSHEDKERLFGGANYDSFDPAVEMAFEGDKLYLLVY